MGILKGCIFQQHTSRTLKQDAFLVPHARRTLQPLSNSRQISSQATSRGQRRSKSVRISRISCSAAPSDTKDEAQETREVLSHSWCCWDSI